MTQEEKRQLLLVDLSARLPFGAKCYYERDGGNAPVHVVTIGLFGEFANRDDVICKPYLRPLSSMTEEEKKELLIQVVGEEGAKYFQVLADGSIDNTDAEVQDLHNFNIHWINFGAESTSKYINWLNAHHFDFRNLIDKGFALEAPEGMYRKETEI